MVEKTVTNEKSIATLILKKCKTQQKGRVAENATGVTLIPTQPGENFHGGGILNITGQALKTLLPKAFPGTNWAKQELGWSINKIAVYLNCKHTTIQRWTYHNSKDDLYHNSPLSLNQVCTESFRGTKAYKLSAYDDDTFEVPMDLFDWLDIVKRLRDDGLTQEEAGKKIGWSEDKVFLYHKINESIPTDILDLCKTHQSGRVGDKPTFVGFNFTEGWFRDSGLYELQPLSVSLRAHARGGINRYSNDGMPKLEDYGQTAKRLKEVRN